MAQNISIFVNGEECTFLTEGSPKDILSVNGVRISDTNVSAHLRCRAFSPERISADIIRDMSVEERDDVFFQYLLKCHPNMFTHLREMEDITFENHDAVVVPHGNTKEIAPDGQAFIVSTKDQSQLSLDFFLHASGAELKSFFNAAANTGANLNNMFAVLHIRGDKAPHTVSPQKYPHIHLTGQEDLSDPIKKYRFFVPKPKAKRIEIQHENTIQKLASIAGRRVRKFKIQKVGEEFAESALHRIISNGRSMQNLFKKGTAEEWEDWRNTLFSDSAITEAAKTGGLRLIVENGIMHIHGGEPLYQGNKPTRWSAKPKAIAPL